jgi:hypothetical protein
MSLEAIIEANTAAIKQLVGTLQLLNTPIILPRDVEVAEPADEPAEPKAAKKAKKEVAQAPQGEPEKAPSAPSPKPGASDASVTAAVVTRADVGVALTMVSAKKGREVAMQILKNAGVGSLGAAQEADYPAILCACELALA